MSEINKPAPDANAINDAPTESFPRAVGPNPDGHEHQAVAAQQLPDAPNLSAAADVARTLPSDPASVNPGTSRVTREPTPDAPPVEAPPDTQPTAKPTAKTVEKPAAKRSTNRRA